MSKYKFAPALALKWYPQGSSGSHWPSKVVWHLCSQSESGWQMHLQPWHFFFGLQEGACYRGQFVIWPCALIIISLSVVLLGSTVIRKKTSRNFKFRSSCQSHLHCGCWTRPRIQCKYMARKTNASNYCFACRAYLAVLYGQPDIAIFTYFPAAKWCYLPMTTWDCWSASLQFGFGSILSWILPWSNWSPIFICRAINSHAHFRFHRAMELFCKKGLLWFSSNPLAQA